MEKTLQQIENEINAIQMHMELVDYNGVESSINYYASNHTKINARKMEFVHEGKLVEDLFKANTKITKNDYRTIVDQLTSYLLGKQPTIKEVDENLTKELPLKKAWFIAKQALKKCQIQKIAWVQPYINSKGMIDFAIRERSDNVIPIYSLDVEKELYAVIIHYPVNIIEDSKVKTITRYEYWDKETVTYYKQDKKKIVFWDLDEEIVMNPRPHVYKSIDYKNGTTKTVENNQWGRVPFIPVQFNEENQTALQMIGKNKIDALDYLLSDGVNNLLDMADVIYILKDYIGLPEEALLNLKTKRAAVVGGDGSVDSLTTDIPMEARKEMIKLIKEAIYEDGMGVDLSNLTGGSLTNVLIEAYFEMLNMKANNVSPEIEKLYTELLTYVDIKQKNFKEDIDPIAEPTITFNKSIIVNEIELAELANKSAGFLSDETRLSFDPRVDDAKTEMALMAEEASGLDEPEPIVTE